jgi:surfactin synthase thioesterase subunit
LLHDQGEIADSYLGYAQQLALITKLNVFAVEYFGCNLGDKHMPTEKSAYESLYAVVKHLNKQYGIANSDIILYGHGLGASVVVSVARSLANTATITNNGAKTEEVAGVILSAP